MTSIIKILYVCPVVDKKWQDIQDAVFSEASGKELVLAGDGRMDSPGHSAQYCVYSLTQTSYLISRWVINT